MVNKQLSRWDSHDVFRRKSRETEENHEKIRRADSTSEIQTGYLPVSLSLTAVLSGFVAYKPALGPTHPPIQWVSGALSLAEKRLGRETNHSPPCSAEFRNTWSYTSTPNTSL